MPSKKVNTGPLAGMRVLDMSRILAGPFCTQLLGDLGADIIKVERPVVGDDTRGWGPPYLDMKGEAEDQQSAYFLSTNRNKRSVALDMARPEDAEILRALALKCDVVIENFKVGGLTKYRLDAATLCGADPRLIYCSITGFGQTGPNAHRPGYDLLAQAFGGIMSLTGTPDGEPMKVGVGVADVMCGMYAANAILAAALHRIVSGEGQHIDVALADTQVSWLVNAGVNYLTSGEETARLGNAHPNIVPYQVFHARDGHLIIAAGNDGQFARLCTILGRQDLSDDPRFARNRDRLAHRVALIAELKQEISGWSKDELVARMVQNGVPGETINTVPEVFASEQVAAREMKISMPCADAVSGQVDLIGNPLKFSETPVSYRRAPPTCGEHTQEVLNEILGAGWAPKSDN